MHFIQLAYYGTRRLLFAGVSAIILFTSCTELIDIRLDEGDVVIVIEGEISNEPGRHLVKVTRSAGYFANQPAPRVSGATVSINDGANVYLLTEEEPGYYYTGADVFGEPGKTYQLSVIIDGTEYNASSQMKPVMPIDSIQFSRSVEQDGYWEVLLFAQEPDTPGDYYMWRSYRNDTLLTDSISKIIFLGDDLINGRYLNGLIVQQVEAEPGDEITLEMLAVPQDYFQFVLTLLIESRWRGGPFDGPPANIRGNISNGALGFFVAYSQTREKRVLPE